MSKKEIFNLRIFLALGLLSLFGNKIFSQQLPVSNKDEKRFIFYGSHYLNDTISIRKVNDAGSVTFPRLLKFQENKSVTRFPSTSLQQNPVSTLGSFTVTTSVIQPSCGYGNGTIILTSTGGTPPYTYQESNGTVQNTGNFPMRGAGTYTIAVTDADGDKVITQVTLANTLPVPSVNIVSYTNASSCTASDASVILQGSGGKPPYTFSMDKVNYQTSNVFTGFTAGLYLFFVKDANGCIASVSLPTFFVSPACDGGYGFAYTGVACGNRGNIKANFSYPNPPYTYSLDGINYIEDGEFPNLSPGIYPVYFKDALGNVRVFAVSIFPYCGIAIDYITVDAACGQNDGVLTVTTDNGTPPYNYTIDGINYQSSNTFSGLAPGLYYVTAKDGNGETNSLGAMVYDRCPVVTSNAFGETCAKNDGRIEATATKGTAPYQYSLDGINFQANNIFTRLGKGSYTVTIKDALGFTNSVNVIVNDECLPVTIIVINSTCGKSNGQLTISVVSGTAPYQYSLDGINFQPGNVFTNLQQGVYNVTVKDATGRTGTTTISVQNIPGPQLSITTVPESCIGKDGSITATGTGGLLPFQYSLDENNFQASNIFNALSTGNYTVWIKDANQCRTSATIKVLLNCPTVTGVVVHETCNNSNGRITVTGANGTPPYQYSINGGNFQTGANFSSLKAGQYKVAIKDALNTTNTIDILISNICPVASVVVNDGLCGNANGQVIASTTNGTPPYQYSIDGVTFQSNTIFTNLASGTYIVTVKDAGGLTNTATAIVRNFPGPTMSLTSNPASCLNNDGSILIDAEGTAPLKYTIKDGNFKVDPFFNNLPSGSYSVATEDANGCSVSLSINVPLLKNISLEAGDDIIQCEGKVENLTAVSNGTAFVWSPITGLDNYQWLNPKVSAAITTKYYIDATLGVCTARDSVMVSVNPAPIANAGTNETICYGQNVQLNGEGGQSYAWSPSFNLDNAFIQNPLVTRPTQSITYHLHVTDVKGCTSLQQSDVTITVTPPVEIFAGNDTSIVINEPFQLKLRDINNSGLTKFRWSPAYGLNNTFIANPVSVLDKEIIYTVMVETPDGCAGFDEIKIKVFQGPDIYVPTAFTPNRDGRNDILKAIPVGIKVFKFFDIYNRWGQRIFHTSNPEIGWNGLIHLEQDTGVFIWITEGMDAKGNVIKRKGTVTLIR